MRALGLGASALAVLLIGGCQLVGGFEDFEAASGSTGGAAGSGGSGNAGGTAGAAGSASCPTDTDPGTNGAPMAQWMRLDGTCFWMDTREVTVGDYEPFIASATTAVSGVCAWNDAAPVDAGAPSATGPYPGYDPNPACLSGTPTQEDAQTCVDWCDAEAFCAWAGKELCGDVSTGFGNADKSDWYAVCSSNGQNAYPYGSTYDGAACNGSDSGSSGPAAPGAYPACAVEAQGGKVTDLSGNVSEWTNACSLNTEDGKCTVRGGHYGSTSQQLACAQAEQIARKQTSPTRGFRCCHEGKSGG